MESHGHFDSSQPYVIVSKEPTVVLENMVLAEINQIGLNRDNLISETTLSINPGTTSRIRKRRLSLGSCLPGALASTLHESHFSKQTMVFFNEEHYLHHAQVTSRSMTTLINRRLLRPISTYS